MADVKICDRCGKTIAATTAQTFGFGAWKYALFNRERSQMTFYDYDLCVDCGEKLYRFLNGEELVKDAQSSNEGSTESKDAS